MERRRVRLDDLKEVFSDALHAALLRSFLHAKVLPLWQIEGAVVAIGLFALSKTLAGTGRNKTEDAFERKPVSVLMSSPILYESSHC